MKVCMFHLMPYRDLPADFVQRYNSAFIDPVWFDVANSEKVGAVLQLPPSTNCCMRRRPAFTACAPISITRTSMASWPIRASWARCWRSATNGQDIAIVQLGSTLPSTTPPTRIAEEYAMLDCISGGRLVAGFPDRPAVRRGDLQRHRADRAARALPRGAGAGAQGVVGARDFRLERQALSARHGQSLAAPDPAAASAGVDSGLRHFLHRRICRRARPLLLSFELFRRQERQGGDRPLLGATRCARAATTIRIASVFCSSSASPRPTPRRRTFTPSTPSISFTSCCTRHSTIWRSRAASNTTRWCRRSTAIRAPRSICASSRPRISTSAASSSSAAPKTVREQLLDGIKRLRIGHLLALLHFGSMPTALVQAQHRSVRPRGAALSRRSVGRQIRGPLVARAPEEEARRRPRHGRSVLKRAGAKHGDPRNTQAETLAGPHRDRGRDRAAAGRRWSICTALGGWRPTAPSSRGSPTATRSMRRNFPAPAAATPRRRTRSTAGSTWSSITASCSTRSSSQRLRSSATPSAACSPPKSPRPAQSRSAAWR